METKVRKVVVADDERLALEGMSRIVSQIEGFQVVGQGKNGQEVWNCLQQEPVDLVVTDIKMPQTDGLWLIRQIEEHDYPIVVIVLSAYDDMEYLRVAIRSRCVFDYLTKPFKAAELQETLRMAARYQDSQRNGHGDLDLDRLLSSEGEDQARELVMKYVSGDQEPLYDFKNRVFGWLIRMNHGQGDDFESTSRKLSEAVRKIEEAGDKRQCAEMFLKYEEELRKRNEENRELTPLVAAAISIVNKELDDPDLNLAMVAERLNVSPNYLSGRFSRDIKQRFSSYLTDCRIKEAKRQLYNINEKIYEVAQKVGFGDVSYFTRVFKENVGVTPLQFRKRIAADIQIDTELSSLEEQELREILRTHAARYPLMEPQDAIKLVYQNEFGPGHIARDPWQALAALRQEYRDRQKNKAPYCEPIGNGMVRINLLLLSADRYPLGKLADDVAATARLVKGNEDHLVLKLEILQQEAQNGIFGFSLQSLKEALAQYRFQGYGPLSHSEAYCENYRPAYRIVMLKFVR